MCSRTWINGERGQLNKKVLEETFKVYVYVDVDVFLWVYYGRSRVCVMVSDLFTNQICTAVKNTENWHSDVLRMYVKHIFLFLACG